MCYFLFDFYITSYNMFLLNWVFVMVCLIPKNDSLMSRIDSVAKFKSTDSNILSKKTVIYLYHYYIYT